MKFINILLALCTFFLSSCNDDIEKTTSNTPETFKIKGLWKCNGYGYIYEITDSTVKTYDICSVNCSNSYEMNREEFDEYYSVIRLDSNLLCLKHGITEYSFARINKLPNSCIGEIASTSPQLNFETFWNNSDHFIKLGSFGRILKHCGKYLDSTGPYSSA